MAQGICCTQISEPEVNFPGIEQSDSSWLRAFTQSDLQVGENKTTPPVPAHVNSYRSPARRRGLSGLWSVRVRVIQIESPLGIQGQTPAGCGSGAEPGESWTARTRTLPHQHGGGGAAWRSCPYFRTGSTIAPGALFGHACNT
ncbi:hypothetical protein J6590_052855 [Homalodisca vitripennis]|nr:hypothetical protein J6590_052855 [Homalodisca vitripennis]